MFGDCDICVCGDLRDEHAQGFHIHHQVCHEFKFEYDQWAAFVDYDSTPEYEKFGEVYSGTCFFG